MIVAFLPLKQSFAETAPDDASVRDYMISDIKIEVKEAFGQEKKWVDMVQYLVSLYIRKGDRFSTTEVNRLAATLKTCRRFQQIHLDTEMTEAGITLIIAVTPFKLIKDIRIHGKYPLFEKKIFETMTLYPGDAFIEEEIEKQPQLIAELYRRYGYIDPRVKIESIQDRKSGHYFLDVFIEKGRSYHLGQLEISGNKAFQDSELRWKMKSIRIGAGSFAENRFLEDLEKLKIFYIAQRFADAVVEHRLTRKPETGVVDVLITIDEGSRYDVSFWGNAAFWDGTLKKDLVLFKTGNRRGMGLRKSIDNIKSRYREAGYPEIDVKTEEEVLKEEPVAVRKLRIVIAEGPRAIVRNIVIAGNTAIEDETLKKQMLTRLPGLFNDGEYVPETLDEDILAIKSLYEAKGFVDIAIQKTIEFSPTRESVAIELKIQEGIQTTVSQVELKGLTAVPEKVVLKALQLKPGRPYSRPLLKNDERDIAARISEKGYPYVQVTGDAVLNEDHSQAHVYFLVVQNGFIERGKTYYSGNFRTKERILDRELEMKPGDPFSLKKMLKAQQNIRSMDIFRSVTFNPVGLKEQAETIHLFTEVEEEKPFYFEAAGGYASEKGLYTTSSIGDHNFFGLNKDFNIKGEISETGYNAESRIYEPRFFGSRISSDLGVYFERDEPFNQTFGTDKVGSNLLFSRKIKKRLKLNLGFQYEHREQYKRDPDVVEDDTFDPRSILRTTPTISYDSRDSFMNPKKGTFVLLGVDISKGLKNSLDDFYRYRCDVRGYVTPVNRLTFAGRGSFGKIDAYGSKGTVPDDQLFFLGGTSSVRGFDENLFLTDSGGDPVGGQLMAVGNAEARIDIGSNFNLSFFYDIGYLDETSVSYRSNNVRCSTGLGLRYVTPVGAIGLIYGHKLNPEPDESPGRVHFSIGYTF